MAPHQTAMISTIQDAETLSDAEKAQFIAWLQQGLNLEQAESIRTALDREIQHRMRWLQDSKEQVDDQLLELQQIEQSSVCPVLGDAIPPGELDPIRVFEKSPVSRRRVAQKNEDTPAPPSPRKAALAELGYDDEDCRILKVVGDYRFGDIGRNANIDAIRIASHPNTDFDEAEFMQLLAGSISLSRDEKFRIINCIPQLSQFQIVELTKILAEEQHKFRLLSPKHLLHLRGLERQHAQDWQELVEYCQLNAAEAEFVSC